MAELYLERYLQTAKSLSVASQEKGVEMIIERDSALFMQRLSGIKTGPYEKEYTTGMPSALQILYPKDALNKIIPIFGVEPLQDIEQNVFFANGGEIRPIYKGSKYNHVYIGSTLLGMFNDQQVFSEFIDRDILEYEKERLHFGNIALTVLCTETVEKLRYSRRFAKTFSEASSQLDSRQFERNSVWQDGKRPKSHKRGKGSSWNERY